MCALLPRIFKSKLGVIYLYIEGEIELGETREGAEMKHEPIENSRENKLRQAVRNMHVAINKLVRGDETARLWIDHWAKVADLRPAEVSAAITTARGCLDSDGDFSEGRLTFYEPKRVIKCLECQQIGTENLWTTNNKCPMCGAENPHQQVLERDNEGIYKKRQ